MPRSITRKPEGQARLQRFDDEAKAKFLDKLATCGLIAKSAWAMGASYRTIEEHRKRDPEFKAEFEQAMALYRDRIEKAVGDRAIDGIAEPIVYQGQIQKDEKGNVITVVKHDNKLLLAHAARHIPEYREKQDIDLNVRGGVLVVGAQLDAEQWQAKFSDQRLPEGPPPRALD